MYNKSIKIPALVHANSTFYFDFNYFWNAGNMSVTSYTHCILCKPSQQNTR